MNKVFLCPGDCDGCRAPDCPERGSLDDNFFQLLEELKEKLEQSFFEKTTITDIFKTLQKGNLFNVIQRLEILMDEGEKIEKTSIEKEIIEMMPEFYVRFKDKSFGKKAMAIVSIIAEKILITIEGKCQESCQGCYFIDCCSQKKAAEKT